MKGALTITGTLQTYIFGWVPYQHVLPYQKNVAIFLVLFEAHVDNLI